LREDIAALVDHLRPEFMGEFKRGGVVLDSSAGFGEGDLDGAIQEFPDLLDRLES